MEPGTAENSYAPSAIRNFRVGLSRLANPLTNPRSTARLAAARGVAMVARVMAWKRVAIVAAVVLALGGAVLARAGPRSLCAAPTMGRASFTRNGERDGWNRGRRNRCVIYAPEFRMRTGKRPPSRGGRTRFPEDGADARNGARETLEMR